MTKIKSVKTILVSAEYGNGKVYGQPQSVKTIAIIKIETSNNLYGIGETYSGIYSPEIINEIVNFLKPLLIGRKIKEDFNLQDLISIPFIGSTGLIKSVISGIEIAYLDLLGKITKKPLYQLLNTKLKKNLSINTYCSGGSVVFEPEEIKREINDLLDDGFKSYKMRVGFYKIKEDLNRIKMARNTLQENNFLMIDSIMGTHKNKWSLKEAIKFSKEIKYFNPKWLEEPLNPQDIHNMAILQKENTVDLAFGESFTSYHEFNNALMAKSSKYLQPDVTHCGYIDSIKLAKIINIKNNKIVMHVWGSKISLLANLHFAIAFNKEVESIEIPNVKFNFLNDEFNNITYFKDSKIGLNDNIYGLGLEINDKVLKKYKYVKNSGFRI